MSDNIMAQEFLTTDNIGNFTFQLFTVMAATEFTKRFISKIFKLRKKENKIATEFIVFAISLTLSIVRTLTDINAAWSTVSNWLVNFLLILINSLIISYLSIASYSKILEPKEDFNKEKDEVC